MKSDIWNKIILCVTTILLVSLGGIIGLGVFKISSLVLPNRTIKPDRLR